MNVVKLSVREAPFEAQCRQICESITVRNPTGSHVHAVCMFVHARHSAGSCNSSCAMLECTCVCVLLCVCVSLSCRSCVLAGFFFSPQGDAKF